MTLAQNIHRARFSTRQPAIPLNQSGMTTPAPPAPSPRRSMVLQAAGLCCAVGYHLDAAVCALRANMDHFQESSFFCNKGEPVRAAILPGDLYGHARLQQWIELAIHDCRKFLPDPLSVFDPARTALVLLCPHQQRPHADPVLYMNLALDALEHAGQGHLMPGEYTCNTIAGGRAGLGKALLHAAHYLGATGFEQVLLIGMDSYLNAADISRLLHAERLFVTDNSNGFMPGEAASALLLRLAVPGSPGLHIQGVGHAQEAGRPDGSVPSRGQGLSEAIRRACQQAQCPPEALEFRISDQNGEQFFAREAANAITRVLAGNGKLPHITIADKIGEVGAAAGPAMLAWLQRDMAHSLYSPGKLGLIHLAEDSGERCAVLVQHFGETSNGNPRLR